MQVVNRRRKPGVRRAGSDSCRVDALHPAACAAGSLLKLSKEGHHDNETGARRAYPIVCFSVPAVRFKSRLGGIEFLLPEDVFPQTQESVRLLQKHLSQTDLPRLSDREFRLFSSLLATLAVPALLLPLSRAADHSQCDGKHARQTRRAGRIAPAEENAGRIDSSGEGAY